MKRLLLLLALLPLGLHAQDSAEAVVGRYLRLLNYEEMPQDSMLVMETTVSFVGSHDTFTLRRWYAAPTMMRVEVWHDNQLTEGLCTNGGNRHRMYSPREGWWNDVGHLTFHDKMDAYDFRGPLFNWQQRGIKLDYQGTVMAKGQRLLKVHAVQPNHFARYYMFEEGSGLLVLIQERDENDNGADPVLKQLHTKPIDYKVIHEYLPAGKSLVPSQESFMRDGVLTIMETKLHFEPRDNMVFNKD
ncbi:MAG: hypothetical protein IK058_01390 [Bacteroidales bacterium]|nr:hypothetical protein [Bacteroidales bacterium]